MAEGQATESYLINRDLYIFKHVSTHNPDGSVHSMLTVSVLDNNIRQDSKYYPIKVLERYDKLKHLGLPVPEELSYDHERATYTISAPTDNENNIYGINFQKNPQISNIDEIKQQLDAIADKSASNGILLNKFAYAITIVNGKGHIILLNILEGSYLPSPEIAQNPDRMNKISTSAAETFFKTLFPEQEYTKHATTM